MRKIPPAEWFLSQGIGPERAAAIMGDLEELAATRGRLWSWTAYVRVLISLGWRAPVAFLVAIFSMRIMFRAAIPWIARALPWRLNSPGLIGEHNLRLSHDLWNFATISAQCLIFVLPFALVRFGARSRVTILAAILLLAALPVYTADSLVRDISGALTLLAVAAALAIPIWRRPLAVLAATCLTAIAVKMTCFLLPFYLPARVYGRQIYHIPAPWWPFADAISFAIAAIVCLYLCRRLLRQRPAIA